MIVPEIIFWIALLALAHTYLAYPLLLRLLLRARKPPDFTEMPPHTRPGITVLISAFNEESLIEEKIRSVFGSDYSGKIEMIVGSDGSTDKTNNILTRLAGEFPELSVELFPTRTGKGNVLNKIAARSSNDLLVLTDAKVIFARNTLSELLKYMHDETIGITGGSLLNKVMKADGISIQESAFMSMELKLKFREGRLWGTMIGAYGALFVIRKELMPVIPSTCLADDFYITMKVIESGKKAVLNPVAQGYLNVTNELAEEFRRKVRIATGNFQNLKYFRSWLLRPFTPPSFAYLSHKVLRWLGPLFLLVVLSASGILAQDHLLYRYVFLSQLVIFLVVIADFFLVKIHLHIIPLRFITHFYSMNMALLLGLWKFLKGVTSNVWEPTKR